MREQLAAVGWRSGEVYLDAAGRDVVAQRRMTREVRLADPAETGHVLTDVPLPARFAEYMATSA